MSRINNEPVKGYCIDCKLFDKKDNILGDCVMKHLCYPQEIKICKRYDDYCSLFKPIVEKYTDNNEPKQIKCPDCGKSLATLQGDILKLWCKGKDCKKVVEVKIKE